MTAADAGRIPIAAPSAERRPLRVPAWVAWPVNIVAITVVLLVAATALLSAAGRQTLPYELIVLDQRLPVIFRIHMAASGLALMLIATTLAVRGRPPLHRVAGRLAAGAVLVGGLTALPSAVMSTSTGAARAGFLVQGCVWLLLLAGGLAAIRARDVRRHRRAMLVMAAVASGALWLRLMLVAIAAAGLPFEVCYAACAWASWLLPVAVTIRLTTDPGRPRSAYCTRNQVRI